MVVNQYEVYWVGLDPTKGHEIQKPRLCVVLSPNEMNHVIDTVIIAPLTTNSHAYPTRIEVAMDNKNAWIVLDQTRTVDKSRLVRKLGELDKKTVQTVKQVLKEMLID